MDVVRQPVKMPAPLERAPDGKGCVYKITRKSRSSMRFLGGVVEKFALGQVQSGYADEFAYLVTQLKGQK